MFFPFFLFFQKKSERTKEKKPYRGGGCAQALGRPSPVIGPASHALRAKIEPLTDARSGSC